ncbi:SUMF1/EgtB/PvdO family nonheme iron enzyme [Bradyrhizobium neotropicale]|uniref:SUMF1/EgtB/PvdO family nonheme iron enzyme n=1 Tax=Bradyrhizobium neotropicale TaxID=1497615 RepID=UPI001AD71276|nr:SUMF1/EgtB/PvdO family nonheme iron enzyme [Bradyrhizobium neotropicale]MBO4224460.1 SUMF1/EgtB/PvdO family nonheme iron enzyme [Bradyrhizobium neotropicale]
MFILMKMKTAMLAGALAAPILATVFSPAPPHDDNGAVRLSPVSFSYRAAGDFSRNDRPVEGPLRKLRLPADLTVMKRQVTVAEYVRCVDDGACPKVPVPNGSLDVPVVGVSWHDASAYAAWLSRRTGVTHRLPTDEEWTFAAAEKARDEALPLVDPADPAQAWIARYEAESARSKSAEKAAQPGGTFGTNSNGLDDLAGNVWEWTDSCFVRASLDDRGERITNTNCGVRVVEGAHRAYMTDFIRDPKSGGCAVGIPPTNLGFRLVVERSSSVTAAISRNVAKLLPRT